MTDPLLSDITPGTPSPQPCHRPDAAVTAAYLLLFSLFQIGAFLAFGLWAKEADPSSPPFSWLVALVWLAPAADALRRAAELLWRLDD